MDSSDIAAANGLPCAFEQYEVFRNDEWETAVNSIPTDKDRIRFQRYDIKQNENVAAVNGTVND